MASPLPEWRVKRYVPENLHICWSDLRYNEPILVSEFKIDGYSPLDEVDRIMCLVAELFGWDLTETLATEILPMVFVGTRDAYISNAIERMHTVVHRSADAIVQKLFAHEHCSFGLPSHVCNTFTRYSFLGCTDARKHGFSFFRKGGWVGDARQSPEHFYADSLSECRYSRGYDAKSAVIYQTEDTLAPCLELFDEKGRKRLVAWTHGVAVIEHNLDAELKSWLYHDQPPSDKELPEARFFLSNEFNIDRFSESWVFAVDMFWVHCLKAAVPVDLPPWELHYQ